MENLYKCRHNYSKKLYTLWQKEKLLVLSNFSFCYIVFKSRLLQMRQNASTCGKFTREDCWNKKVFLLWSLRFLSKNNNVPGKFNQGLIKDLSVNHCINVTSWLNIFPHTVSHQWILKCLQLLHKKKHSFIGTYLVLCTFHHFKRPFG